ncbi:MAG: IS21 family transposase, partial [Chloroflexota bacterium]
MPYASLRYFVVKEQLCPRNAGTVRMADTKPGQYAEMDFERLGYHQDPSTGRRQLIYALLVVLCYSRHIFVWPMLRQQLEAVIEGLEAAWRFFGGVPCHLILDN